MTSPGLDIRLLGSPRVVVDGEPMIVDTRKAVALIAYLAVTATPVARDELIELLWPGHDPDRGRAVFRRTLSALRTGLGGRWIEADRDSVRLAVDGAYLDTAEVETLVRTDHDHGQDRVCPACVEPLARASGLFRGEFLAGFSVRDTPEFYDWQASQGQRWRRLRSQVCGRLAEALVTAGRYDEAVAAARDRLEVDPLHEPAHRRLMLFLAWVGDRSGAVDAYRACVRLLDIELGVEPLEETTELYEAILDEDLPPLPGPPLAVSRAFRPHLVKEGRAGRSEDLVGRHGEIDQLRRFLSDSNEVGLAVISGEPGIGKTRLIEELGRLAGSAGLTVLAAAGYRGESNLAFGAVARLIRASIEATGGMDRLGEMVPAWAMAEASRLVPELGRPPSEGEDPAGELRLLEAVATILVAPAAGGRVLVSIDDAHWLDGASVALLGYLARRLDRWPLLMALSFRAEDLDVRSPLPELADRADLVLSLDRLGVDEVAEWVKGMPGAEVDPELVHQVTGGLPLLVADALDTGRVDAISTTVRRSVGGRLDDLSSLGDQLVTTAAVLDGPIQPEVLEEVSGRSGEEVADALDELMRRGFLRPDDGGFGFQHDAWRSVAYERASPMRLRLLHRRAAERLADRSDLVSAAAAARHFRSAGMDRRAADAHRAAGDLARGVYAAGEAATHYETALALGHAEVEEIRLALGDVALLSGDYAGALREYRAAAARADGAKLAQAEHRIGEVHRRLGAWDLAEDHFRRAEQDHPEPAVLQADWALLEHRRGYEEEAGRRVELAVSHARAAESRPALARALDVAGVVERDPERATEALLQSLDLARADPVARMAALHNLAALAERRGDAAGALSRLDEALDLARTVGDRHREAAILDRAAGVLRVMGRPEESAERQRRAVELFADVEAASGDRRPEIWLLTRW